VSIGNAQVAEPKPKHAWTAESALEQLQLYPRDPYLQYVFMQLATRAGNSAKATEQLSWLNGRASRFGRASNVDLFSIFSGALAVQESLQLDAMTGEETRGRFVPPGSQLPTASSLAKSTLASLTGPTVKSHPWNEMLAGRTPEISPLAQCVPEDFLFVKFRSVGRLLDTLKMADELGIYVAGQTRQEARTQAVTERLKRQLAVDTSDLMRPIYDTVIEELAIASSDLFFREGTDVTLIMQLKQPQVFRIRMDQLLNSFEKSEAGAQRSTGVFLEIPFTHVSTPDRTVHVFSAYPRPDLHIRTNSRIALQRTLEAIQGKTVDGRDVRRLGDSEEFSFIRTMMPEGAAEEDGFLYMSDPFIRKLVGPQAKLSQRRRLVCYNHLRMIGHASLMHTTETGKLPASLDELRQSQCLPKDFGSADKLGCPASGNYELTADGLTGVCSHHGRSNALIPCCEIPISTITQDEATEYKAFVDNYNQYWRTFFDPIAVRFQLSPNKYRIETVVLPLIDNSVYTNLSNVLGGTPETLDDLPVPDRNIFSVSLKIQKQRLMDMLGLKELIDELASTTSASMAMPFDQENRLTQLGLAIHNFESAYKHMPPMPAPNKTDKSGLSWRVHLLPYVEQSALYDQFKLDEPWDSDHNKRLIPSMPPMFQGTNPTLAAQGKTHFVFPRGEKLLFSGNVRGGRFGDITDGLANTIMLVQADDEHAVVWTQPQDLEIDLAKPRSGWTTSSTNFSLILMGDGSLVRLLDSVSDADVRALLTRNSGEVLTFNLQSFRTNPQSLRAPQRAEYWKFMDLELLKRLHLMDFFKNGIGEQISLHLCDADPLVDFNAASFLGMAVGSFSGRRGEFNIFNETGAIALLAMSINAPLYVAVPVKNAEAVDKTLKGLDDLLARLARRNWDAFGGFFEIQQDYYQVTDQHEHGVRSYAFRFGPLKWRFFWTRVGNGLYVASKPFIINDLISLARKGQQPNADDLGPRDRGPTAHGMIRLRPLNWKQVLPHYQIGWAENQRLACLHNLGPLSSVSRALHANQAAGITHDNAVDHLTSLVHRVFDSQMYCPSHGRYIVSPEGNSVSCSVHGSALSPRQSLELAKQSRVRALTEKLKDVSLALTFLEDGLQAVVTVERK